MRPSRLPWVVALLASCGGPQPEVGPYRHVLLISLDTLRADHLGCYGAARPTPSMDWLAADGARFAAATVPAPTTLSSHTSMMTGTWPHTHGVVRNGYVLDDQNVTLAEVLREHGFATAAVVGSFALESRFGFDQGFDAYDDDFEIEGSAVRGEAEGNDQDQKTAESVTRAALAQLDRMAGRGSRMFLFVHYFDAHANYAPPPRFARAVTGDPQATSDMRHVEAAVRAWQAAVLGGSGEEQPGHRGLYVGGFEEERLALLRAGAREPSELDRHLAALYAGEVAYVDEAIGKLLDGLRERGLLDETLIVLTGDHGETFWEHGDSWNHGLWVYQTTVAVPWILRLPDGRFAGRVIDDPVSTVDLLPTLCELLGIEAPQRCEGRSQVARLAGAAAAQRPVFSEATQPHAAEESPAGWGNATKPGCVRLGDWKYVHCPYNGHEELFDLASDPLEQRNLLEETLGDAPRAALDRLRSELAAWRAAADPLPSRFDSFKRDETLRILDGLGYGGGVGEEDGGAEGEDG